MHNNVTDEVYTVDAAGVFIYVGVLQFQKFADLGITNERGWIETNERMETTLPGIYALGDVREKELRQITTAVGDAAIAGQNVFSYNENFKLQQRK